MPYETYVARPQDYLGLDDPTRPGCLCRDEQDVTRWCGNPVTWAGLRSYKETRGGGRIPAKHAFACDVHSGALTAPVPYGHPEHRREMERRRTERSRERPITPDGRL